MSATWYDLQVAIMARYSSSAGASLRTALGETTTIKKWFAMFAPHTTVLPYAVFMPLPGSMSGSMTDEIKEPIVQFSVFVDEYQLDQGINSIAPKIATLFSDIYMQLNGGAGHVIGARRVTPILPIADPDGGYQITQDFHYRHD